MITHADRAMGGIVGLLVGDALGVPYETTPPTEMPDLAGRDLLDLPPGFVRRHPSAPTGAHSDDGGQALCLLDALLAPEGFTAQGFGERLVRWLDHGYLAAQGGAFGTGRTTRTALGRIRAGVPAATAGLVEETALGNGGLMRALPVALHPNGADPEWLVTTAIAQCGVTHKHPLALATVATFTLWARRLLQVPDSPPWQTAREACAVLMDCPAVVLAAAPLPMACVRVLRALESPAPTGGFHVLDTFVSAVIANEMRGSFGRVVHRAISFGNDTDTTAAVAGGIAGIRYGLGAIPPR